MQLSPEPRRTKILATIGPAVQEREQLLALARSGMNVARLNFSHGEHATFARIIADLRWVEAQLGRPIGILGDIQGPKIRTGKLENKELLLEEGATVWMSVTPGPGGVQNGRTVVKCGYKEFIRDVPVGATILLDDGLMALRVETKDEEFLKCVVVNGGVLKENKGIHVPEATFSAPAITDKDYGDILFCLEQGVDFLALSFVRTAQEVRHLKNFIASRGQRTQVISKIEMREALENLDEIIDASDGILVARGDLAVEVGNERVPVLQKKMVRRANLKGKTAIIATQMLMSMVDNPRPTRAEASDVANAIVDGADVVMLSNETAIGKYPCETIQMMDKIAREMEAEPSPQPVLYNEWLLRPAEQQSIAILQSAVRLASILEAKQLVVVTQSGQSARLISKCRPRNRVLAITGDRTTYRQLSILWGVDAECMEDMPKMMEQTSVFDAIGERLRALKLASTGDKIVITAGLPKLGPGSTNTIKLHIL
jgi:pyruvate kinase